MKHVDENRFRQIGKRQDQDTSGLGICASCPDCMDLGFPLVHGCSRHSFLLIGNHFPCHVGSFNLRFPPHQPNASCSELREHISAKATELGWLGNCCSNLHWSNSGNNAAHSSRTDIRARVSIAVCVGRKRTGRISPNRSNAAPRMGGGPASAVIQLYTKW